MQESDVKSNFSTNFLLNMIIRLLDQHFFYKYLAIIEWTCEKRKFTLYTYKLNLYKKIQKANL
jgi:hypothetical protein